jgi:hypothetical protein
MNKACRIAVIDLIILLFSLAAFAQLPDAPQPQHDTWKQFSGKQATFFTFRKSYQDPPLRTNRQAFSKKFIILHALLLTSFIVDNHVTHGAREKWDSEGPAILGVGTLDYAMTRFFTEAYSVEGPVYGIQHYIRDALK